VIADPKNMDFVYRETRQQLMEQSAEIERVDRKATALFTPLGLLIGLALNSRAAASKPRLVDWILYLGLASLIVAILFGVVALWPRQFQRMTPGGPAKLAIGRPSRADHQPRWRRLERSVGNVAVSLGLRLSTVGEETERGPRATEQRFFYSPTWVRPSELETLEHLNVQLAAAWRINDALFPAKLKWLRRQFVLMVMGSIGVGFWFVLRNSLS